MLFLGNGGEGAVRAAAQPSADIPQTDTGRGLAMPIAEHTGGR